MADKTTHQQLDQMITGYWISQAIYAAAKFGIADHLKDGPKTVGELAGATSTNADALYRLLRALASVGVFSESQNGDKHKGSEPVPILNRRFALTPLAEPLRSDVVGSKRALAIMSGDEQFRAWAEIDYSIRTGKMAWEKVFGKPIFDYLGEHPDKARIFDAAMVGIHGRESSAILSAYDFSGIGVVADIGGGNGSQITEILKKHSRMKGILFDLPHVVERAKERIHAAGLADRCQLVSGSFFDAVPPGADAYLMRHIIHDWDEPRCLTILGHVRKVIPPAGRLLVVEGVIPPGNGPSFTKLLDLNMLVIPGGQERTEEEYRGLFAKAGFRLTRVVPTRAEVSVLEGAPA
jgi:ubiquinone/menaquinone biosynthesis C-methylase UbiE